MQIKIEKWGNGATVRLPAELMAAAALQIDQAVELREEGGCIIISPVQMRGYDLDELLARMGPETFHDEAHFGAPVGQEAF